MPENGEGKVVKKVRMTI